MSKLFCFKGYKYSLEYS